MRTVIIDRDRLIRALIEICRTDEAESRWTVTLHPVPDQPLVEGRVISGKAPTVAPTGALGATVGATAGGYDPRAFLAEGSCSQAGERAAEDEQGAENWIEANLLDTVELGGETFTVLCAGHALTTTEAAEYLKIKPVTARKWAAQGWFPHAQRYGRDWLIPAGDLLYWRERPRGPQGPRK